MAAAEGQAAPQRQRRRGKGPSIKDVCSEGDGREGWSKSRIGWLREFADKGKQAWVKIKDLAYISYLMEASMGQ